MKKNALFIATFLASLLTVAVMSVAYAEGDMNGTEASTSEGCKKCKCSCGNDASESDEAVESVDDTEDESDPQEDDDD